MGITGHGQISQKFKGERCNSAEKTASRGNKINTNLIEYATKRLVKKEVKKPPKHVDNVINSIKPLPLPVTKSL